MLVNMSNDRNIPTGTEAYYETVASQEEIYLEETEEELRAILIFGDPPPSPTEAEGSMSDASDNSDDPPLSEEVVVEMMRMTKIHSVLGRS